MFIGTVQQIWRHPVKSMAVEKLNEGTVGPLGIPGDRGWALRDEKSGEITNGKRIPNADGMRRTLPRAAHSGHDPQC